MVPLLMIDAAADAEDDCDHDAGLATNHIFSLHGALRYAFPISHDIAGTVVKSDAAVENESHEDEWRRIEEEEQ